MYRRLVHGAARHALAAATVAGAAPSGVGASSFAGRTLGLVRRPPRSNSPVASRCTLPYRWWLTARASGAGAPQGWVGAAGARWWAAKAGVGTSVEGVTHVLAVASGKGGVGKSTTAGAPRLPRATRRNPVQPPHRRSVDAVQHPLGIPSSTCKALGYPCYTRGETEPWRGRRREQWTSAPHTRQMAWCPSCPSGGSYRVEPEARKALTALLIAAAAWLAWCSEPRRGSCERAWPAGGNHGRGRVRALPP